MAVIMVEERFDPPIDLSQGSPVADKVSPCLPVYDVNWLSSYISTDGTKCVCLRGSGRRDGAPGLADRRRAVRRRVGGEPVAPQRGRRAGLELGVPVRTAS